MKGRARFFVPLAAFVALAALLAVGLTLKPREVPSPFIGKPAPAFTRPQLKTGQPDFDPAQMKGQVWVLNVWASWCAPCREEHPILVAAARQPGAVPIVGLNYKDEGRAAEDWLRRLGDPYQAVAVDRDGRVGIDYGVYGVPETFVIDRDGIVRLKHIGPLTAEDWTREVVPLLNKLKG
ncbi:MAG: DsbE family thiol:disulfide interchange protein [Proteobacteria bacterium]|nr:DsbE family thiol:disulfide interchange protein [Pseudomonadota bacterium]